MRQLSAGQVQLRAGKPGLDGEQIGQRTGSQAQLVTLAVAAWKPVTASRAFFSAAMPRG
jgi:hypothetical protein